MYKYKVGAYLRLSKEEFTDNKESNSIINQKQIINSYINEHSNLEVVDYYIDDGYSGTDFNRPEFKRLLNDLKNKKVNTIIVKDLSRLGRNYIEVGNYIENIFPMLKVRFISINDNIDSKEDLDYIQDIIPLKNITNDYYAKDISRKVRSVLDAKKLKGEFIGSFAPYGYVKDIEDKHKLVVDKDIANIVKKIFDMTLEGKSRKEIAIKLNDLKVEPPGSKINGINKSWNSDMLTRILRNETYIGTLIQGKKKRVNYRIHKIVGVDREEWIIIPNHHNAIISKEKFEKVQAILNKKLGYRNKKDLFSGYLKCPICEKSLIIKKSKNYEYYYCSSFVRDNSCTNHSIRKERLYELVLENMKNKFHNEKINKLNAIIIDKLIDKIFVYDKNKIEIIYKNEDK